MSITIIAVRSRSTVTFCGAHAIVTGTGVGGGIAMLTSGLGRPPRELPAKAKLPALRRLHAIFSCLHGFLLLREHHLRCA